MLIPWKNYARVVGKNYPSKWLGIDNALHDHRRMPEGCNRYPSMHGSSRFAPHSMFPTTSQELGEEWSVDPYSHDVHGNTELWLILIIQWILKVQLFWRGTCYLRHLHPVGLWVKCHFQTFHSWEERRVLQHLPNIKFFMCKLLGPGSVQIRIFHIPGLFS